MCSQTPCPFRHRTQYEFNFGFICVICSMQNVRFKKARQNMLAIHIQKQHKLFNTQYAFNKQLLNSEKQKYSLLLLLCAYLGRAYLREPSGGVHLFCESVTLWYTHPDLFTYSVYSSEDRDWVSTGVCEIKTISLVSNIQFITENQHIA